jgi:ubiquinone/menaquinone biosynthesis C-methylase UbiE
MRALTAYHHVSSGRAVNFRPIQRNVKRIRNAISSHRIPRLIFFLFDTKILIFLFINMKIYFSYEYLKQSSFSLSSLKSLCENIERMRFVIG